MALERDLGGDGSLFVGEDKIFTLVCYQHPVVLDEETGLPASSGNTIRDLTGKTVRLVISDSDNSSVPKLNQIGATSGTFNSNPATNTQKVTCTFTDTEFNTLVRKIYRYSWKLDTDGEETILAYGYFEVQKATAA